MVCLALLGLDAPDPLITHTLLQGGGAARPATLGSLRIRAPQPWWKARAGGQAALPGAHAHRDHQKHTAQAPAPGSSCPRHWHFPQARPTPLNPRGPHTGLPGLGAAPVTLQALHTPDCWRHHWGVLSGPQCLSERGPPPSLFCPSSASHCLFITPSLGAASVAGERWVLWLWGGSWCMAVPQCMPVGLLGGRCRLGSRTALMTQLLRARVSGQWAELTSDPSELQTVCILEKS